MENPTRNLTSDVVSARRLAEVETQVAKADVALKDMSARKLASDISVNEAQKSVMAQNVRTAASQEALNSAVATRESASTQQALAGVDLQKAQKLVQDVVRLRELAEIGRLKASTSLALREVDRVVLEIKRLGLSLPELENRSRVEKTQLGKKAAFWDRVLESLNKVIPFAPTVMRGGNR